MPPEAMNDDRSAYRVVSKSFTELLEHIRNWRYVFGTQNQQAALSQFACPATTTIDPVMKHSQQRFYALGTCAGSKDHTILYADVPPANVLADAAKKTTSPMDDGMIEQGTTTTTTMLPSLEWKMLLRVGQDYLTNRGVMTKEEELLRERMRCMTQGISAYDYEPSSGTFLFSASGHLYRCVDDQKGDSVAPSPVDVPLNVSGAPLDPKLCPANPGLVACVCRNELYVNFGPTARQVTFSHDVDESGSAAKLCGVPSYVIQEEFDRFSGYWWRPIAENGDTYYILYEETDESAVVELSINVPATRAEHVELMRYPRAGTNNPSWVLKLLKIQLFDTSIDNLGSIKDARIEERHLTVNLRQFFPWAEYLIRAGWLPDGSGIWFQLMSRVQDRLALVYAPLDVFGTPGPETTTPLTFAAKGQAESMEDLTTGDSTADNMSPTTTTSKFSVLYEEFTPGSWINYHDILTLLNISDTEMEFLWASGKSGFYHIYRVTSSRSGSKWEPVNDHCVTLTPNVRREIQLTSGDWDIRRKCRVHVDKERKLLYFMAYKESPLEPHIYVTCYERPGEIRLLTDLGYSYGSQRSDPRPFCISADGRTLVTSRCNLAQPGECVVYSLTMNDDGDHLPRSTLLCKVSKSAHAQLPALVEASNIAAGFDNQELPTLFAYDNPRTEYRHYAYLFKPRQAKPGFKFPTLLYVYAGPEVQQVKNVWMGSYGFHKYTSLGYAVVVADGRGTPNRGVQFEATLKLGLGAYEIEDQVDILTEVARRSGVVDLERVALLGWSYGGYMALIGLAQRPDIFKVAIAGAPVTVWSLYDTAYTERYLGMPQFNQEGYVRSSVLSYVNQLPSETGRLLLLHGLIDENVHYRHTATLISALVRAGKPYQLQVFPNDRHAVRNSEVNEHMDATVLDFLQRNL